MDINKLDELLEAIKEFEGAWDNIKDRIDESWAFQDEIFDYNNMSRLLGTYLQKLEQRIVTLKTDLDIIDTIAELQSVIPWERCSAENKRHYKENARKILKALKEKNYVK